MSRRLQGRGWQGLLVVAATSVLVMCAGFVGVTSATGRAVTSRSLPVEPSGQWNAQGAAWQPIAESCGVPTTAFSTGYSQSAAPVQSAAAEERPMSDAVFKNVQVLKGIPADEFMGTMGLFSAALGICCLQCHQQDWAVDTPRKMRARSMLLMMNNINRGSFSSRKEVTCWTCHRGNTSPQETPVVDLVYSTDLPFYPEDMLQQAPGQPPAEQILDKYIQAVGGAERLSTLTSFVAKGHSMGYGAALPQPVEVFAKAPNQRTTIVHTPDGDTTATYDGRAGWQATFVSALPVTPLTGGELEGAKLDAQLAFPGQIKQLLNNWRVHFPTSIDDRQVQVVQGDGIGGFFATFYFDDESGLLRRVIRYTPSAIGRVPTQIDITEYREVAGIKLPSKWNFSWLSGRDIIEIDDIQVNPQVDAAKFVKPAPAAQK